ncbi:MAG: 50S ribosomal protein L23 [Patescibacteria group bacterium]|nr:50S ribosomal protein L23 [Patescibacteria group bacterium]
MSYRVLHSPHVSEKAATLSSHNVYVLNVPVEANKLEIAKAVKDLFGVTVEGVRTARGIGKILKRGRTVGQRNRWKKAYVTIKQGQKIDLYEGV